MSSYQVLLLIDGIPRSATVIELPENLCDLDQWIGTHAALGAYKIEFRMRRIT